MSKKAVIDVQFQFGRRDEHETLILELLASQIMNTIVSKTVQMYNHNYLKPDIDSDPADSRMDLNIVVATGLRTYTVTTVKRIVNLFQILVRNQL